MLRALIVDDEPLARLRLGQLLGEASGADGAPLARAVGEAGDAAAALAWLKQHEAEVVFLDVQMPGLDGIGLAAKLQSLPRPPAVVFVTAHAEHALRAFELEAVDYLTKPVKRERLQVTIERIARRLEPAAAGAAAAVPAPVIVVSERGRLLRVPLAEVLYLKAELKYVTLRTAAHSYVLDDALSDLEQRLGERFLRVHRNAIVARSAVQALERRASEEEGAEGWAVCVRPTGEWLAVSRRQASAVREALAAGGL
ncbi:MAG TPA: LytTR family DNA-binding domain-containing protein [Methylibium sp.]|nr:LytTR family DNA-binding domain-containing protein [Methylibium sp.]